MLGLTLAYVSPGKYDDDGEKHGQQDNHISRRRGEGLKAILYRVPHGVLHWEVGFVRLSFQFNLLMQIILKTQT
jgi:hypothetical protein